MREAPIVRQIMLAASKLPGVRLLRNTVALATLGPATRIQRDGAVYLRAGDVVVTQGRITPIGLHVGSADLLGWRSRPCGCAQFTSVEVKAPKGRVSAEQQHWHEVVSAAGACSGIVRSVDEAVELLRSP